MFDSILLSNKITTRKMTYFKSACDRKLPDIGGMLEKPVGADRNGIKVMTKVIPNWEHHVSTGHGISENIMMKNK